MKLAPLVNNTVLILVVMEDSLGRISRWLASTLPPVLILVVMEDSLGLVSR